MFKPILFTIDSFMVIFYQYIKRIDSIFWNTFRIMLHDYSFVVTIYGERTQRLGPKIWMKCWVIIKVDCLRINSILVAYSFVICDWKIVIDCAPPYAILYSLLDNAPNYVVGCIIQKGWLRCGKEALTPSWPNRGSPSDWLLNILNVNWRVASRKRD